MINAAASEVISRIKNLRFINNYTMRLVESDNWELWWFESCQILVIHSYIKSEVAMLVRRF